MATVREACKVEGRGERPAFVRLLLCVAGAVLATAAPATAGNPVTDWNVIAARKTIAFTTVPVEQTRLMAIVQISVHDAVNGITKAFEPYGRHGSPPAGASPEAAAIAAAYYALGLIVTGPPAADLDDLYAQSLATHGVAAFDPGLDYGRAVAAVVFALRTGDGSSLQMSQFPFTAPNAGTPGVWELLAGQTALRPGWGNVRPFVLKRGWQFRPDPPPALNSEQYAKDLTEVLDIGRNVSPSRVLEQEHIARFWRASPTAIWNVVLETILKARNPDLSTTARSCALVYLAAADASVAVWEAKYFYNFWRPEPAIVRAYEDGNPSTHPDATWKPLLPTPPHPEYPSAHTANSGAMAFVLSQLFGDAPGVLLEVTQPSGIAEPPMITRQWGTLDEALDEVIEARIYSGIHFRTADVVGARLGRQVGQFVLTHALRPKRPGR
ncbi:MAG: vanadium-dependent haloperoxidase [Acidobacteria bacterium]|nr:vanadium-dependent haloperoxidase [Acidobacteriota bacterium]